MIINDITTFKPIPHLEFLEEYWSGGFDMNIQDVGIIVQDLETGHIYECSEAIFEHGVDEYSINTDKMKRIEP